MKNIRRICKRRDEAYCWSRKAKSTRGRRCISVESLGRVYAKPPKRGFKEFALVYFFSVCLPFHPSPRVAWFFSCKTDTGMHPRFVVVVVVVVICSVMRIWRVAMRLVVLLPETHLFFRCTMIFCEDVVYACKKKYIARWEREILLNVY